MKIRVQNFLMIFLVIFCMQNCCLAMKGKRYKSEEEVVGDIIQKLEDNGARKENITKKLLRHYFFRFKRNGQLNYKLIVSAHKLNFSTKSSRLSSPSAVTFFEKEENNSEQTTDFLTMDN